MSTTTKQPSRVRHIRIPDVLWIPACEKAEDEGRNPSELIRDLLRDYLREGK